VDIEECDDLVELFDVGDVVFDGVLFCYGEECWMLYDVMFWVFVGIKIVFVGEFVEILFDNGLYVGFDVFVVVVMVNVYECGLFVCLGGEFD